MTITIHQITPEVSAYLTAGGEWGFVRYEIHALTAAIPGFSGATTSRSLVEAVFVAADDAELAALVLNASRVPSLRTVFDARGIPYRLPHGVHATEVIPLRPDASSPTDLAAVPARVSGDAY